MQDFVEMCDGAADAHGIAALPLILRETPDILDGGEDWQVGGGSFLGANDRGDAQQHRHDQDHPGCLSLHGGRNTIPGRSGRPVEIAAPGSRTPDPDVTAVNALFLLLTAFPCRPTLNRLGPFFAGEVLY